MKRATKRWTARARGLGFTLIEMLLVITIIGLIGGMVVYNLVGKAEGANVKLAGSQIKRLGAEIEAFYLDTGHLPESLDDLTADSGDRGWNGPYVQESQLEDPWNNRYQYRNPGDHGLYDLYSYGADGRDGGDGNNADITNWD